MKKGHLSPTARRHVKTQRYHADDLAAIRRVIGRRNANDFIRSAACLLAAAAPHDCRYVVLVPGDCPTLKFWGHRPPATSIPEGAQLFLL